MKKIILTLSISAVLVSCGSKVNDNLTITALNKKKDSLQTLYDNVAKQISEVENKLKEMDNSIKLPLVTIEQVNVQSFSHFVEVQGAVETSGNALLYPEANGTITRILIKEGQQVNKGDVLIKIDAGMLQSSLKEAETQYDLVKKIYEKQNRLWKEKIGSEIDYLQAKTNKENLEQRIKTIKEQLEMYVVKAPFSGIVDEISPKVGEAANPMIPVVRIINYKDTYLKADVSEDYINKIKKGTKVKVFFSSLNKEYEANIERAGDFINPGNRTFKIRVALNGIKEKLKPNLLADISIQDFYQDTAIVIPSKNIQQDRKGNDYIYLIDNEKGKKVVKKAIITTGLSYNNTTIVLSGLEGNEKYINKGARSIQAGDEVEVIVEQEN